MWVILSVSVLLTTQSSFVWTAYPFTFSERECRDLFPERIGKDSLSDHASHDLPFEIEPSDSIYGISPNGIHVTVKAVSKWRIKGIIMQARVAGNCENPAQQHPVGHFETKETSALMSANCPSGHQFETVTHKTYPLDKDNFIIRWFPPEKTTANIYFVATIVSGKDEFWTGIASHVIRHNAQKIPESETPCPMRNSTNADGGTYKAHSDACRFLPSVYLTTSFFVVVILGTLGCK